MDESSDGMSQLPKDIAGDCVHKHAQGRTCGGCSAPRRLILSRRESMAKLTDSVRERIVRRCRDCCGGTWALDSTQIFVHEKRGGLSNYLFLCSLADSVVTEPHEPRTVLIRVYGEILRQSMDSVVLDSVIFALLSEKKLGPRLYGVFRGGRIEEFVQSRVVLREELCQPRILKRIAMEAAVIHSLEMPLSKAPRFMFATMDRWLVNLEEAKSLGELSTEVVGLMQQYDLHKELQACKEVFIDNPNFPVVFCHNDLQENNILYFEDRNSEGGFSLLPIDYEFCSYNYRGYEIGNIFSEFQFDYTHNEWPYFSFHDGQYPSRELQVLFWRTYLGKFSPDQVEDKTDDELLTESLYGSALANLFWTVWALVQTRMSSIEFGYFEHADCRIHCYYELKKDLACLNSDCRRPSITAGNASDETTCRMNGCDDQVPTNK